MNLGSLAFRAGAFSHYSVISEVLGRVGDWVL